MGQKHQSRDADAHIMYQSLGRHRAKMLPGKLKFLVVKAEASFVEESPNPKIHVVTRWFLGRWLDTEGGGEENTKQRLRSSG